VGLTTRNALSKAFGHLRRLSIEGHPILHHYRVRKPNGQFGKSFYHIFPDAGGGDSRPAPDLVLFDPKPHMATPYMASADMAAPYDSEEEQPFEEKTTYPDLHDANRDQAASPLNEEFLSEQKEDAHRQKSETQASTSNGQTASSADGEMTQLESFIVAKVSPRKRKVTSKQRELLRSPVNIAGQTYLSPEKLWATDRSYRRWVNDRLDWLVGAAKTKATVDGACHLITHYDMPGFAYIETANAVDFGDTEPIERLDEMFGDL
jgi:hypothetical protein